MKKHHRFCVILVLMLVLCACAPSSPYTVSSGGKSYSVDPVNRTITGDAGIYTYEAHAGGEVTVRYPGGATFTVRDGAAFGSPTAEIDGHPWPTALAGMVDNGKSTPKSGGQMLLGVVLAAAGALNIWKPHTAWRWDIGWKIKNAEPSDDALDMIKLGGVVAIIIGVLVFFAA